MLLLGSGNRLEKTRIIINPREDSRKKGKNIFQNNGEGKIYIYINIFY